MTSFTLLISSYTLLITSTITTSLIVPVSTFNYDATIRQLRRHNIDKKSHHSHTDKIIPLPSPLWRQRQRKPRHTTRCYSSTTANDNDDDDDDDYDDNNNNSSNSSHSYKTNKNDNVLLREKGMTAALFSTCFAIMGSKCALPATMALLTSPSSSLTLPLTTTSPSSSSADDASRLLSHVLTLSTMAIAVGKTILGPVIDSFGGVPSLQASLIALAVLMGVIGAATSFSVVAACFIMVDFIFSVNWPACLNAVHQSFPEEQWGGKIGMLAAACRMGNTMAFATFSLVLKWAGQQRWSMKIRQETWRPVFFVSALIQIVPLVLLTIFGKGTRQTTTAVGAAAATTTTTTTDTNGTNINSTTTTTTLQKSSPLSILLKEMKTLPFWLHFISRSALMVFGSFLLFVPTFMSHGYNMNPSSSARVGSAYALGCLLSITTLSKRYNNNNNNQQEEKTKTRQRRRLIATLLGLSTLCSLSQYLHVTNRITLSPLLGSTVMFLWGYSFAVPFYIPPSLYALETGGRFKASATIADAFDVGGFGVLAAFNGYVAGIEKTSGVLGSWATTFGVLTMCSCASLISLILAIGR